MLPLVITVERPGRGREEHAFADSPVRIGRSPFSDLQLTEPFVSRIEGVVRFDQEKVTYFYVGSTNAMKLDGQELPSNEDVVLPPSSELSLGPIRMRFVRKPVPDDKVHRKGAAPPQEAEQPPETVFLSRAELASSVPSEPAATPAEPQVTGPVPAATEPSPEPAPASDPEPRPPAPPEAEGAPPSPVTDLDAILGATRPIRRAPSPADGVAAAPPESARAPASARPAERPPAAFADEAALEAAYEAYRQARDTLREALETQAGEVPAPQRAELAPALEARYPDALRDPVLRQALEDLQVVGAGDAGAGAAELDPWLRGLLPAGASTADRPPVSRVVGLLEMLAQSFAEIGQAQGAVRERWLGQPPRDSLLGSDNGRVILGYLLDPTASWEARHAELKEAIGELITHEWAIFRATLSGARALLDSLSPDAVAEDAGDEETASGRGIQALLGGITQHKDEARLWRAYLAKHEGLAQGERYQRVFLGRQFARIYLSAMGRAAADSASPAGEGAGASTTGAAKGRDESKGGQR